MKFKYASLVAFAAVMMMAPSSHAIFGWLNDLTNAGCTWNFNDPMDLATAQYERLTTPLPEGLNRKVVPFRESDLRSKPWISAFEYVIVVNNSSPYKHYEELPAQIPYLTQTLSQLGIVENSSSPFQSSNMGLAAAPVTDGPTAAMAFLQTYGAEADKVRRFGEVIYTRNSKGQKVPMRSGAVEPQTVRIYHRGQLIRKALISTGRGSFQLRGRKSYCEQPVESYHTFTEPGYYTFQELLKEYKSKSYDADMPNAMFYNRGRGLALHEVNLDSKIAALGTRASGGCTRMDPNTAATLFEMINPTQGATIPMIDVYGNPVLDARRQVRYKNQETIVYGAGTSQEARRKVPAFNALLIIQPDPVVDASPANDEYATFKYHKGY